MLFEIPRNGQETFKTPPKYNRYRLSGQQEAIINHQNENRIITHYEIQCFCEKTWKLSETISAQFSIEIWESVQFRGLWCLDSRSSIPKSFFIDGTGDTYCISGVFRRISLRFATFRKPSSPSTFP